MGAFAAFDRTIEVRTGYQKRWPGRILQTNPDSEGYPSVTLHGRGARNKARVHVLAAAAFIGPCPEGQRVLHWDDVPTNNVLDNLRYGTQGENVIDCVRNGNNSNSRKTHCAKNHPFSAENTRVYIRKSGRTRRVCLTCERSGWKSRTAV